MLTLDAVNTLIKLASQLYEAQQYKESKDVYKKIIDEYEFKKGEFDLYKRVGYGYISSCYCDREYNKTIDLINDFFIKYIANFNPNEYPIYYMMLAVSYKNIGDNFNAIKYFNLQVKYVDADNPDEYIAYAHLMLGDLYIETNDKDYALINYRKAAKYYKHIGKTEFAKEIRAKVKKLEEEKLSVDELDKLLNDDSVFLEENVNIDTASNYGCETTASTAENNHIENSAVYTEAKEFYEKALLLYAENGDMDGMYDAVKEYIKTVEKESLEFKKNNDYDNCIKSLDTARFYRKIAKMSTAQVDSDMVDMLFRRAKETACTDNLRNRVIAYEVLKEELLRIDADHDALESCYKLLAKAYIDCAELAFDTGGNKSEAQDYLSRARNCAYLVGDLNTVAEILAVKIRGYAFMQDFESARRIAKSAEILLGLTRNANLKKSFELLD